MKTSLFIAIVLLSGCSAGIIHGLLNLAIVEPFLDTAIGIENEHRLSSGQNIILTVHGKKADKFLPEQYLEHRLVHCLA
jgi:hypothetical protein